ncbi:hypothetical protein HS125_17990 [bacterium]|nr:hypothetical protein [bacterium]
MDPLSLSGAHPETLSSSSSGRNTEVVPALSGGDPGQPTAPVGNAVTPGDRLDLTGTPPALPRSDGPLTLLPDGTYALAGRLSLAAGIETTQEQFALSRFSFLDTRTGARLSALDLSVLRERTSLSVQLDWSSGLLSQSASILPQGLADTINRQATQMLGKDGRLLMDYLSLIKHLSGDEEALGEYIRKVEEFLSQGDVAGLSDFNAQMQAATGTPVGAAEAFELRVQVEVQEQRTIIRVSRIQVQPQPPPGSDPLILDLDGNGVQLAEATYDLTGDGVVEKTATAAGGDAFLAWDRNRNGAIDGGRELFGDQHGAVDGFAELARFDADRNGLIDARDPIFAELLLFRDDNRDGLSQPSELSRLSDYGIVALSLQSYALNQAIGDHRLISGSTFIRNDGTTGRILDAAFAITA